MTQLLESIKQFFSRTLSFFQEALQGFNWNPLVWESHVWFIVILLLLLCFVLLRSFIKAPQNSNEPELLVSQGVIQQPENSPTQILRVKISNLNNYPIQLLEMSVQSELMSSPFMVESAEIVSAQSAVELEAILPNNIVGDRGLVEIYAYLSKRQNKIYKLKTNFAWEPWAQRYKIEAVGQQLKRSRQLASTKLNQARKRAWYQYNMKAQAPVIYKDPEDYPEPNELMDYPEDKVLEQRLVPSSKPSRRSDMDFPADF